jgi:hypothetical protein
MHPFVRCFTRNIFARPKNLRQFKIFSRMGPGGGNLSRLKAKLFRRSPSPAAVDVQNEIASTTPVSSLLSSAEEPLLPSASNALAFSTSAVHALGVGRSEIYQQASTPTVSGSQRIGQSERSPSSPPRSLEPSIEHVSTSPPSSPKKDLWREALKMLSKETQQRIEKMGVSESRPQPISHKIGDLVKIAKTKQEECEKKFWRFRVGNHEIIIRDYAVQIIGWLQKIGDVAIQFAPPQASLPWAAIKAVMRVRISVFGQQFGKGLARGIPRMKV